MLPMPTSSIYHICTTKTVYQILALTLVFLPEDTLHLYACISWRFTLSIALVI